MKYCNTCGKEVHENAKICPGCGCEISGAVTSSTEDAPSTGLAVLSFCFPIAGLILYLIWKKDYPKKASSCGKGALISTILSVIFFVILIVVEIVLLGIVASVESHF